MTVRFSADARRDRREAEAYYQRESPSARWSFRRELETALRFIVEYPEGAPVRTTDIRAKRLLHFPYTILYRVVGTRVFVLAIACQLRHPKSYDDRLT